MIVGSKTAARVRRMLLAGSVLAGIGLAAQVAAQSVTDQDAIRFGVRESVLHISLSPSGKRIAYIAAGPQHTEVVKMGDLAGERKVVNLLVNTKVEVDLDRCDWADDSQLVCRLSGISKREDGVLVPFDRLYAVNSATKEATLLIKQPRGFAMQIMQNGGDLLALDVGDTPGKVLLATQIIQDFEVITKEVRDK